MVKSVLLEGPFPPCAHPRETTAPTRTMTTARATWTSPEQAAPTASTHTSGQARGDDTCKPTPTTIVLA